MHNRTAHWAGFNIQITVQFGGFRGDTAFMHEGSFSCFFLRDPPRKQSAWGVNLLNGLLIPSR